MKNADSRLGVPLPEKDYGSNCRIYDWERPDDPWHNILDKLDGFVISHFIGWWLTVKILIIYSRKLFTLNNFYYKKTLVLRNWWMCLVTSIGFEFIEYSLEHQLPNFSECWWDHVSYIIFKKKSKNSIIASI